MYVHEVLFKLKVDLTCVCVGVGVGGCGAPSPSVRGSEADHLQYETQQRAAADEIHTAKARPNT